MKTIVYLYTEIMPYQTIIFNEYSKLGYVVHAFYLDKIKQTPFTPNAINNVFYYPTSIFNRGKLLNKIIELNPDILLVCGWSNREYLKIARYFNKKKSIPVISPIDTQFSKRLKQYLGFIFSFIYIKSAFSHIWVPGYRQYEFARLLGYSRKNIIFNSLSADVELFEKVTLIQKEDRYPKRFLFVGRFHSVKGLDLLINTWDSIKDKNGWVLTLIGNGPEKKNLQSIKNIEILDFLDQKYLVKMAQESGCFILPSLYEPWALVIHEFACAGLPIICSDACGASDTFVVNGFNGYNFRAGNKDDLKCKIETIINCNEKELLRMSLNSRKLGQRITPEISAASFLSLLK